MKSIMLYLSFLFPFTLVAQSVDWFETIGVQRPTNGSGNPFQLSALSAEDSVVYVGGSASTYEFFHFYRSHDSIQLSNNGCCRTGAFVAQYTADGRFRWARPIGSRTGYINQKMAMTSRNGAVYAAVILSESGFVGLDTVVNRTGMSILLVKFDKNGREVWRNISNSFYWLSDDILGKLIVDDNENLYLAGDLGTKFRSLSFDNLSTTPKGNQFVFRFDANGKAQQVHTLQESRVFNLSVKDLQTDGKGAVYLMLSSGARSVLSSCAYQPWRTDIFRLDAAGSTKKVATFNCTDLLTPSSLGIAENGDFLVAGRYHGTIELGEWRSPSVSCGSEMGFVLRLNAEGQLIWFKDSPIKNENSDNYRLLREKEGNWLVAGYQNYDKNDPTVSANYPNIDKKYPNGKRRFIVRRLSPMGVQLDSVTYYTAYYDEQFSNMLLAQNSRKTYLAGVYECYFDSLSVSTCYREGYKESFGDKIFIAQISDKVLKIKTLPTNLKAASLFTVLPNPTEGNLQIRAETPLDSDADLSVTDISGRLILQRNLQKGQFIYTFNLADVPSGVYFVRIQSKDNVWIRKITKI
jgi:hypothetical protein